MSQWLNLINSENHAYDKSASELSTTVVKEALDILALGTLRHNLINGYKEQGVDLGSTDDKIINLDGRTYQFNEKLTKNVTITVGTKPTAPICASAVLYVQPNNNIITFSGIDYWVNGKMPKLYNLMQYVISTTPTGIVIAEGQFATVPFGPSIPPPPTGGPKDAYGITIDTTEYDFRPKSLTWSIGHTILDWQAYTKNNAANVPYRITLNAHNIKHSADTSLKHTAYPDGTVAVVIFPFDLSTGLQTVTVLVAKGGEWWVCSPPLPFNDDPTPELNSRDVFKGLYIYDPGAAVPPSATILKTPQEVGHELGGTGFALMKVGNTITFAADPAWGSIGGTDITSTLKLPPGITVNDLKGYYFGPTYAPKIKPFIPPVFPGGPKIQNVNIDCSEYQFRSFGVFPWQSYLTFIARLIPCEMTPDAHNEVDPTDTSLKSTSFPDGTVMVLFESLSYNSAQRICIAIAKGGKWWICTGPIIFNDAKTSVTISKDVFKGLYIYDPKAVVPPSATILKTPQEVGNELGTTGFALMKVGNTITFAADPAWGRISGLDVTSTLKLPPGITVNDLKGYYFGPMYT